MQQLRSGENALEKPAKPNADEMKLLTSKKSPGVNRRSCNNTIKNACEQSNMQSDPAKIERQNAERMKREMQISQQSQEA